MVKTRESKENIDKVFDEVKNCSMIHPSILESEAFTVIQEEYLSGIWKGPDRCKSKMLMQAHNSGFRYCCDIKESEDICHASCIDYCNMFIAAKTRTKYVF